MKISKYNHRPVFFNCSTSFKRNGEFATLYLDIHKDLINDYSFEQSGMEKWVPEFSLLGEKILGKNLSQAREVSLGDGFISLPLKLLQNALDEFSGQTYRYELLKEKSKTLICRCFGVFKGQILDVLKKEPGGDLITILDGTGATGGCSSCKQDVDKIVEGFRGEEIILVPRKERVLGLCPVDLHLKIDEIIKEWDAGNEVSEIKNNLVIIKAKNPALKKYLDETFAGKLLFSFLS